MTGDVMEYFKSSENKCNQLLGPWEPHIMTVQSLLVWENPQHTAILLVVVNILFWYVEYHWLEPHECDRYY